MPLIGAAARSPKFRRGGCRAVAGCRLRAVALEQRLRRGERPALDAVVRQQPRNALQKARIVIDHDHDCAALPYPCPSSVAVCAQSGSAP
jgi:hypothetical protein